MFKKNYEKFVKSFILSAFLIVLVLGLFLFDDLIRQKSSLTESEEIRSCSFIEEEKRIVRGHSMEPFIENGQEVTLYKNYHKCHPVKRNDIVVYDYAGRDAPLIKSVKAIPGDSFSIEEIENREGKFQIMINNKPVKNSEGKIYAYSKEQLKMLFLYAKDYPKIPKDTYLLLADNPENAIDSTKFGLVSREDIIGIVK